MVLIQYNPDVLMTQQKLYIYTHTHVSLLYLCDQSLWVMMKMMKTSLHYRWIHSFFIITINISFIITISLYKHGSKFLHQFSSTSLLVLDMTTTESQFIIFFMFMTFLMFLKL